MPRWALSESSNPPPKFLRRICRAGGEFLHYYLSTKLQEIERS
jgi:hypothetical protein